MGEKNNIRCKHMHSLLPPSLPPSGYVVAVYIHSEEEMQCKRYVQHCPKQTHRPTYPRVLAGKSLFCLFRVRMCAWWRNFGISDKLSQLSRCSLLHVLVADKGKGCWELDRCLSLIFNVHWVNISLGPAIEKYAKLTSV